MTGNKSVPKKVEPKPNGLGLFVKGTPGKGQKTELSEADALESIFGSEYSQIQSGLLRHCLKILKADEASDEYPSNDEREFLLSAVAEIKPRDTFERMLSVQMAATHLAMIRSGRWLANLERIDQVQAH